MKNTILYVSLLFVLLLMTSCNGPIGYAIHVAKTDTHTRSYNTNEEADDDTVRFVIHKDYRQMLMKAEINGDDEDVAFALTDAKNRLAEQIAQNGGVQVIPPQEG